MRKLTPTAEELAALRRNSPSGPLVAVNLLKFKPDGGRAAYSRYMEAASAALPVGVKVLHVGTAGPDFGGGEDWDFVIIAEYPSADSFADFVTSQRYREHALPLRPQALERTVWLVSYPATLDAILN